ncbi:MAG: FAD-dependent oxidoreductase [Pedosphaera sp.]|nr:FAD-dependent oxidoreductase [Pedosphaera sp.]
MNNAVDIAIVGSGFAGSLLAMIARRLGRSVALIERGRHPRFVIGESSTPLANLLLEELAQRYDLPQIASLSKWGTWQRNHPDIACGLKRGFTFFHHEFGRTFEPQQDRANELLVAASPHDGIADTHWYRSDFDHFFVKQAQALSVEYFDEVALRSASFDADTAVLDGERNGKPFSIQAQFVVDATGPRGFLHRALGLAEAPFKHLPATQGLYSHFRDVRLFREGSTDAESEAPPYPPDDAAIHHVFDGGWIWVLRFNNGITSAGAAVTDKLANELKLSEGAAAWERLLSRLPAVREQFSDAKPTMPFVHSARLSFRSSVVADPRWALLPSAAGFIDPLLSTGFPLTLLGVDRLARSLAETGNAAELGARLETYSRQTTDELLAAERLVAALYANMDDFPIFSALSLLYFAAASFSETARRLGKPDLAPSFLLHNQTSFGPKLKNCCELALSRQVNGNLSEGDRSELLVSLMAAIEPIDVAGLSDGTRRNWHPVLASDLLAAAAKLGVDRAAICALLERCGFNCQADSKPALD